MGKRSTGARRRRPRSAAEPVASELLPDALRDIPTFEDLTYSAEQAAAFEEFFRTAGTDEAGELQLGCVIRLDRGFPLVTTKMGAFRAEHAVSFAKHTDEGNLLPAVGDWVAVRVSATHDMGVIERVLPRKTAFERWRGTSRGDRQTLAANLGSILVVIPLGADRDLGSLLRDRLSRALVLVMDCGAVPVIVFTKADRADGTARETARETARRLAGEQERVIMSSVKAGIGLDEVAACVPAGSTAMMLGESGAGKSTLLNALLGSEVQATGAVRSRDDKGRHTTVARVMMKLPAPSGVLVDAPGLRSLPLVGHEHGLERLFPEIVKAAQSCRFRDCTHTHEPGCAVQDELAAGALDPVRLEAYVALSHEMAASAERLDPDIA